MHRFAAGRKRSGGSGCAPFWFIFWPISAASFGRQPGGASSVNCRCRKRRAGTGRNRYCRPVRPIVRRWDGQPTAGAGFQCHREPGRQRCGGPVHAQRGSPWSDIFADRLRCAWSPRRPCHFGDQQDRLRRRHLLTPDPGIHIGRPRWVTPGPRRLHAQACGPPCVPHWASALCDTANPVGWVDVSANRVTKPRRRPGY